MYVYVIILFFIKVLLTECGRAFTCGLGSVGQLGHGGTKNLSIVSQMCMQTLGVDHIP